MASPDVRWSFSSLKQYINCPQNYYRTRVTQEYKTNDTTYTIYGKAIHKAIEDFILHGVPFPKHYADPLRLIPELLGVLPTDRRVECAMAVRADRIPCHFDAPNYWVRGIADFIGLEDSVATVIDWKTGSSRYADIKLKLMGLLIFAHYENIQRVKSMLYFTKNNEPIIAPDMHRENIDAYWASFDPDLTMLNASFQTNNWPMKPSGLCGFCPVSSCAHQRG